MAREARPAFQIYTADFIADHLDWSNAEIGAAMRLRVHQWRMGSLPADLAELAKLARCSGRDFQRLWNGHLEATFLPMASGGVGDPELERQRAACQKYSEDQSKRAKSRWTDDASALPAASAGGISHRQSSSSALALSSAPPQDTREEISRGGTIADRPPLIPSAKVRSSELVDLCSSVLNRAFVNNLQPVADRLNQMLEMGLVQRAELPRRTLEAWRDLRARRLECYRGKLDGFGLLEYWPDIEAVLRGLPAEGLVVEDGRAPLPIARLDFKKGGQDG